MHQLISLPRNGLEKLLPCCRAQVKTTGAVWPKVNGLQHLVDAPTGPSAIESALLGQHHQVMTTNGFAFAAQVHLVLAARAFAVGEVETRGQVPLPLGVESVGKVFRMVITVVSQHIEYGTLKGLLNFSFILRDQACGAQQRGVVHC